ncbi:molybdenum cofactor biosynthesis protein MoaE [Chryseobacterium indoltheticum]|uniref:Molybdopterin synthase catalytic subunit n=1 Tax=Chryseobacterium indoltheticum TaxID=254 RepID=A0A3G6MX31_9FLAO|nr:molybdenum cofactor biosynthesis protein MoaE [Chryseobacterium indoltheticum]AZA60064.1 molybdenum cofactor biosynthesis protein MoaE [Chryseobacterium indoltheticum]
MSKIKNIFQHSPISPLFIAESITKHSTKTEIGAHQIFLGQIRADEIDGKTVKAIEYTAYQDLALSQMTAIREEIFEKYDITCMHIHHSLGTVHVGEICLFVFTSSKHRNEATMACNEVVERIKNELPIWGREIFEDETYQWKINQ